MTLTIHDAAASGLIYTGVAWSNHPDFPDYLVGYHGEVLSLRGKKPKILKASSGVRYPAYTLRGADGKFRCITIHSLVASVWIGERPDGMECCHNDGDRKNADASNLRWDTPVNNNKDKIAHGTHRAGEKINFSKLNEHAVVAIRKMWRDGIVPRRKIAKKFNVSYSCVAMVASGATWSHIREGLDD
jgi:hypothetical protein